MGETLQKWRQAGGVVVPPAWAAALSALVVGIVSSAALHVVDAWDLVDRHEALEARVREIETQQDQRLDLPVDFEKIEARVHLIESSRAGEAVSIAGQLTRIDGDLQTLQSSLDSFNQLNGMTYDLIQSHDGKCHYPCQ